MNKKTIYWIVGIILVIIVIYIFAPPIIDFSGNGSRFNQWLHRNDPIKGIKGAPLEYKAGSDYPSTQKTIQPLPS
jgi:hypothetical protein